MQPGDAPSRVLRLGYRESQTMTWDVRFEPPVAGGPEAGDLWLGSSPSRARIAVHVLDDLDDGTEMAFTVLDTRTLAHLWHVVKSATGGSVPIRFVPAVGGPVEATLDRWELHLLLEQTEQAADLAPRTESVSPPIYLQAFWGPRQYGRLDAMIARLEQFNIVPEGLLARAQRSDVPNNWALVCPPGLPNKAAVLEALHPLVAHRGGRVFELAHGADPAVVDQFVASLTQLPVDERPYYLLVLGDLDVMSIEYQYFLHSFGAAGRLALDTPEAYAAYAEKIIRWETGPFTGSPPSLLYVATDTDDVNTRNFTDLVEPLASAGDLPPPSAVLAHGRASKRRVVQALSQLGPRSVAFLSAHGFEHLGPAGYDIEEVQKDQLAFQGALVLDDFDSARPLGSRDGLLTADDVAGGAAAPGGVLVLHACYSAGTVPRETLPEWVNLDMPPRLPPSRPFVSRLSQALLANPEGPLALYAHINRSHQYQYYDPEEPSQSLTYRQYHDLLRDLYGGRTIGLGRELARRMTIHYMSQAMTLSHQLEWLLTGQCLHGGQGIGWPKKGVGAYERSFLDYSFATCNFRNYLILGDPMVKVTAASGG